MLDGKNRSRNVVTPSSLVASFAISSSFPACVCQGKVPVQALALAPYLGARLQGLKLSSSSYGWMTVDDDEILQLKL